eukprot:4295119-Amphidinium_carterae.1
MDFNAHEAAPDSPKYCKPGAIPSGSHPWHRCDIQPHKSKQIQAKARSTREVPATCSIASFKGPEGGSNIFELFSPAVFLRSITCLQAEQIWRNQIIAQGPQLKVHTVHSINNASACLVGLWTSVMVDCRLAR